MIIQIHVCVYLQKYIYFNHFLSHCLMENKKRIYFHESKAHFLPLLVVLLLSTNCRILTIIFVIEQSRFDD